MMRAPNPAALRPMRLLRIPEPFDHPDWLYEVKFDGFCALAHVNDMSPVKLAWMREPARVSDHPGGVAPHKVGPP